jgi:hypothetical protein
VYGDDIILPSTAYTLFAEMVDFYGFRINEGKSFYNSPFRESCGAHYHSGIDITPIYVKHKLSSILSACRLANAVRRWAHRRLGNSFGCDQRLKSAFGLLVSSVPSALRIRIPEGLGDGGFVANLDEAAPARAKHGIEGFSVPHLQEVSSTYQEERIGYLLSALWRMSKFETEIIPSSEDRTAPQTIDPPKPTYQRKAARNSVPNSSRLVLRLVKSVVQRWYSFGPWI